MQLKQRIKKIEERLGVNNTDSKFCGCWKKHFISAVNAAYNENPDVEVEVYPLPDFEKGFCDKCKKPISSSDVEGQEILKMYENENESNN